MNHIHCIFRTITEKANYKYDLYVWGITKAIFFNKKVFMEKDPNLCILKKNEKKNLLNCVYLKT